MSTPNPSPNRKLRQARLAARVVRFNTLPSDDRTAAASSALDEELESADRDDVHVEAAEAERQEERVCEWLEGAANLDGETDPVRKPRARTGKE